MYTGYRRFRALCRGFRSTPSPLPRRIWGLFLALLPLAPRRWLLQLVALWTSAPPWLVRVLSGLGGYLVMSAIALLVLWLWGRVAAPVCSDTFKPSCAPAQALNRTGPNLGKKQSKRTRY
ncbi:hypothetical protein [Thiocapsa rosea]|uniref:Uncharacterized protein n=1 Tax=Thiocapsa rosea TaxID=69360 RepID=A0A495UR86_9GAMM|nr:hypothetical protein [Thiocapsa rosea]RKT37908.1 hypothetical protein BDD21_5419 [Thiocapsa rosea]